MALTWTDVNSKTNKFIVPRQTDNVYRADPLYVRVRSNNRERFEGGTSIKHGIMYAELNGGAFRRGEAFNISAVNTDTAQLTFQGCV